MPAGPTVTPTPLEPIETLMDTAGMGAAFSTVTLPVGEWSPATLLFDRPRVFGLLIAEGIVVRDLLLAGSVSSELLGAGDLLPFTASEDGLIELGLRWTVADEARLVLLDEAAAALLARQPAVAARLLQRAGRQAGRAATHRAISQLPRIEQRLVALFWYLGERWGRMGSAGVVVPLSLTHETLGRLVGAKRPTVSLALKALALDGTLGRRADGAWVLDRSSGDLLLSADGGWPAVETAVLATEALSASQAVPPLREPEPARQAAAALRSRVADLAADFDVRRQEVDATLSRCAATRTQAQETRRLIGRARRGAA